MHRREHSNEEEDLDGEGEVNGEASDKDDIDD